MKRSTNYEYENVSIFELLKPNEEKKQLLNVGDKIGRVVLGECRIATVTAVEGLPDYPFYRTDNHGCYNYSEGLKNILEDFNGVYDVLPNEITMDRLYFSNKLNGYASAEYTRYNR